MNRCRFCDLAKGLPTYGAVDSPFLEDEHFIAISSIGSFVEGWSLIVPKTHGYSMKDYYSSPEFAEFYAQVVDKVSAAYGPVIAFEHGSQSWGSLTSCGTDHSHLHIVPFAGSLVPALRGGQLDWQPVVLGDLAKKVGVSEYLLYVDSPKERAFQGLLHTLKAPISQYFRNVLAQVLAIDGQADYKTNLLLENSLKTLARLSS